MNVPFGRSYIRNGTDYALPLTVIGGYQEEYLRDEKNHGTAQAMEYAGSLE